MTKQKTEKSYCVVAEDRTSGKRMVISNGSYSKKEDAETAKQQMNRNLKKIYRYFHVAAYPYKQGRK